MWQYFFRQILAHQNPKSYNSFNIAQINHYAVGEVAKHLTSSWHNIVKQCCDNFCILEKNSLANLALIGLTAANYWVVR